MNAEKSSLMEFYQEVKQTKMRKSYQQSKAVQNLGGTSSDHSIPFAYCDLCMNDASEQ